MTTQKYQQLVKEKAKKS